MNKDKIPAIPPNDYKGTVSDWMVSLLSRGLMECDDWYGDIMLSKEEYEEILMECE